MAIFLVCLAGMFVALSNLFMRRSLDGGGTAKGFLVFQMLAALAFAVLLEPVRTGNFSWNVPTLLLGIAAGLILALLLFFLGKALEQGPPGFTFSILSAATVMPGIVMTLLFGASLGFPYTAWHGIGSLLVLAGLFWAGLGLSQFQNRWRWIVLTAAMFSMHVLLLVLFQWRAFLLNFPHLEELTRLFTQEEIRSAWFLPCMFLFSGIFQLLVFSVAEKRLPRQREILYGSLGGAANGLGTFLLICAVQAASPLESAIVFPMYSVAIIVLSNWWGQKLYQESVNWKACRLAAFGLVVGTVDWKSVAAFIGF